MAGEPEDGSAPTVAIRIDKWLWHARFFKTRGQATRLCADGRVRVGGAVVTKAHYLVRLGDVLTFPQARDIRVVRIAALGTRRGSPREAQALYRDLAPPRRRPAVRHDIAATKTVGSPTEKY